MLASVVGPHDISGMFAMHSLPQACTHPSTNMLATGRTVTLARTSYISQLIGGLSFRVVVSPSTLILADAMLLDMAAIHFSWLLHENICPQSWHILMLKCTPLVEDEQRWLTANEGIVHFESSNLIPILTIEVQICFL